MLIRKSFTLPETSESPSTLLLHDCPKLELNKIQSPHPQSILPHEASSSRTIATQPPLLEEDKEMGGKGPKAPRTKLSNLTETPQQDPLVEDAPVPKSKSATGSTTHPGFETLRQSKAPDPFQRRPSSNDMQLIVASVEEPESPLHHLLITGLLSPPARHAYEEFLIAIFESLRFIRYITPLEDSYILAHALSLPRPPHLAGIILVFIP
jgi:hypothetical protein